jgi:hypothetical protein
VLLLEVLQEGYYVAGDSVVVSRHVWQARRQAADSIAHGHAYSIDSLAHVLRFVASVRRIL